MSGYEQERHRTAPPVFFADKSVAIVYHTKKDLRCLLWYNSLLHSMKYMIWVVFQMMKDAIFNLKLGIFKML